MSGYFDTLADVVPPEVIKAMEKAATEATWHGAGREGEPAVLASVRALIGHMVLRAEHDQQIRRMVEIQRADAQVAAEALARRVEEVRAEARESLRRLVMVRQLLDHRRKTLSMARLHEVLDTPIS